MTVLVWVMIGIAVWHFTVWVPDRFWGGIVGSFLVAAAGGASSGSSCPASVPPGNPPGMLEAVIAMPGALIALGLSYVYGSKLE